MTDPIGQGAFNGLAVPLYGESVIRQQNSSNAILSLIHSSLNTGRFVMGMDYSSYYDDQTPSSVIADLAVFDIDADGGFRGVSGSTVLFEINSSGLYQGSTAILEFENGLLTAPRYREAVVMTAASTALTLTSAQSGCLVVVSSAASDTQFIILPATPHVGDNYEVFCNATAAAQVNVKTAATGDAQGFYHYASTGVFDSTGAVTNASSGPIHLRFTAISSGSMWIVAVQSVHYNSSVWTGLETAGSTST